MMGDDGELLSRLRSRAMGWGPYWLVCGSSSLVMLCLVGSDWSVGGLGSQGKSHRRLFGFICECLSPHL